LLAGVVLVGLPLIQDLANPQPSRPAEASPAASQATPSPTPSSKTTWRPADSSIGGQVTVADNVYSAGDLWYSYGRLFSVVTNETDTDGVRVGVKYSIRDTQGLTATSLASECLSWRGESKVIQSRPNRELSTEVAAIEVTDVSMDIDPACAVRPEGLGARPVTLVEDVHKDWRGEVTVVHHENRELDLSIGIVCRDSYGDAIAAEIRMNYATPPYEPTPVPFVVYTLKSKPYQCTAYVGARPY
jgi:hypothetical protein